MEKYLWVEKYAPKTIEECILPAKIKAQFSALANEKKLPNLILSGPPGIGKTTIAKVLCDELDASIYFINGSDEGRFLDTIRQKAKAFASTASLGNRQKVIIIDEADNTTTDVQLLLRASIEEFQNNCKFIFTCNYKNKIIPALLSRCSNIEFVIKGIEKAELAIQFKKRLEHILHENDIEYDKKVIVEIIKNYFPDWRRILNECQQFSTSGKIDSSILVNLDESSVDKIVGLLKSKKYDDIRKWVFSNVDLDFQIILRRLFDDSDKFLEKTSIPSLVLLIAKYQESVNRVADKEIHLLAFFTEMMIECEFL
jgi:replication factor C small subunit